MTKASFSDDPSDTMNGSSSSQPGANHYDRQLERISQMLSESHEELRKSEKAQTYQHNSVFGGKLFSQRTLSVYSL